MEAVISTYQHIAASIEERLTGLTMPLPLADLARRLSDTWEDAESLIKISESSEALDRPLRLVLHYEWVPRLKSLFLLWRDVVLEHQRAAVFLQDEQIDDEQLLQLSRSSIDHLLEANQGIKHDTTQVLVELGKRVRASEKKMKAWEVQQSPWPVYQSQLQKIVDQTQALADQHPALIETNEILKSLRELVEEVAGDCEQQFSEYETIVKETIGRIGAQAVEQPSKVLSFVKQQEQQVSEVNYAKVFSERLDQKLHQLPEKLTLIVASLDGMLQQRELNPQRSIRQWIESEVSSVFVEMGETNKGVANSLKIALLNIKNRVNLHLNEQKDQETTNPLVAEQLLQPIEAFQSWKHGQKEELQAFKKTACSRVQEALYLHKAYDAERDFLPVPLQSTLRQLRIDQNPWLVSGYNWVRHQWGKLLDWQSDVRQEERRSTSEKVVRFLQQRELKPGTQHYANVFLTEGFINESFLVGRDHELEKIGQLVRQWEAGYRGAVLLCGKRFCGKSDFGEMVANEYFSENTIRLNPSTTIDIDGRRHKTSFELSESLDFIRKYSLNRPLLVWIDDIEAWTNPQTTLSKNIRSLTRFIESNANRLFFIVSTSNWMLDYLNRTHGFDKFFQTTVNLDQMSEEMLREALIIRHGATHTTLVDEDGQEISPGQFRRASRRVYQAANGVIGDALQLWASGIKVQEEEEVLQTFKKNNSLPDLVDADNALLLSTIMLYKQSDDYQLSKLFGAAFKEKYAGNLQRLISVGVVQRADQGRLIINPRLVNALGEQLEQHACLKFTMPIAHD